MQLYLTLLFLLSFVECSYISFISNNADKILETDLIETLSYATLTVGEPYVAQSVVVTRVSAASHSPLSVSPKNRVSASPINSQDSDSNTRTAVQLSLSSSNYASQVSQKISAQTNNDPVTVSNIYANDNSKSKSSVDNLSSVSGVASVMPSASTMRKVTTLLSQTASTSTSTLFS